VEGGENSKGVFGDVSFFLGWRTPQWNHWTSSLHSMIFVAYFSSHVIRIFRARKNKLFPYPTENCTDFMQLDYLMVTFCEPGLAWLAEEKKKFSSNLSAELVLLCFRQFRTRFR